MKINKKIKIAVGSVLGIVLLLSIVLVVHIATVKPTVYDNATLQISRINFEEPIDSLMAKEINRDLKSITGVKNPSVFADKKVVVFYHDMNVVNSEQVYNQFMAKGKYKAARFVVPKEIASNEVCPVMDKNSFSYKFSRGIQRIFN
ncbi:hypothetical protein FLAN108750_09340 [Flavobacterium antarcticum]|uniref:hypothetical protein n=1 Tax=Flavobacterium antarcticum TaxID=271155 RepID=UPI0003B3D21F|nr:hypothetical protein [Flavobacterium antarcticum]